MSLHHKHRVPLYIRRHFQVLLKLLTDGLVRKKRLVIETKDLSDIVEIGMLNNKRPLAVVPPKVEIGDGNLDSPISLVVELQVPVHTYRTHMFCAL